MFLLSEGTTLPRLATGDRAELPEPRLSFIYFPQRDSLTPI
jgi:hypothetical protein